MNPRFYGESRRDKRLSRMILLSALVHVAVITAIIVVSATRNNFLPGQPTVTTVTLVNPAALGTNLPSGAGKNPSAAEPPTPPRPTASQSSPKPEVKEPPKPEAKESLPVKKEEPKALPLQPKETVKIPEKPAEKPPVPPPPEKTKLEEKKPEPKPVETKPEPQKTVAKVEEKKPEPKKLEPEKVPAKGEEKKPEVLSPEEIDKRIQAKLEQMKTQVKNTDAQKSDALSPEEIDKRIQAKLEQMKTQVKERDRSGVRGNAPGSGPVTKGGTPGEGGGGIVRGLELIMYNDQIQRRVQTNWVVAEKKPGLVATVSFRIQPDGEMLDVELVKPSGDTAFDQSVVRAIKRTNPLPPPPQAYQQDFATQGVLMNFGGEGRIN